MSDPPCGAQVLVPVLMLPLIESGELVACCRHCNGGRKLSMHPVEAEYLARQGRLEEGLARLEEINEDFGHPPDPDPLTAR